MPPPFISNLKQGVATISHRHISSDPKECNDQETTVGAAPEYICPTQRPYFEFAALHEAGETTGEPWDTAKLRVDVSEWRDLRVCTWMKLTPASRQEFRRLACTSCEWGYCHQLASLQGLRGEAVLLEYELETRLAKTDAYLAELDSLGLDPESRDLELRAENALRTREHHDLAEVRAVIAEETEAATLYSRVLAACFADLWIGKCRSDRDELSQACVVAARWDATFSLTLERWGVGTVDWFNDLLWSNPALAELIHRARPHELVRTLRPGGGNLPTHGLRWLHQALREAGPEARASHPDSSWSELVRVYGAFE